ncbi:hypothetical protein [Dickeya oryzae]|nr:hypothetical protein [Dickeya oryzae]
MSTSRRAHQLAILVLLGLLFLAANALPTMTTRYADKTANQEVAE